MAHKLLFIDGEFAELNKTGKEETAMLEIIPDGSSGTSRLTFSPGAGLIARRTASRQAENVCKSGFLLGSGERIGIGTKLEIVEGDSLSEAHLREGHKYNR
ncbi:MAG: hypothetical protein ACXAD7_01090 [Candidatus Kariarchaeaceae archaeon]|jgi:hypothetical protein